jgi:micrococcal nuclease
VSNKKMISLLGGILLFVVGAIVNYISPEVKGTAAETVTVTRVIDGDTIVIDSGEKVRLIGVDTPETVDPKRPDGCFGKNASEFTKSQLLGKSVRLEKDVSETDKYKRLLRYVWINDVMFNELLVRQGYAQVSTYPPDVKYQDKFLAAQKEARNEKIGLWNECFGD